MERPFGKEALDSVYSKIIEIEIILLDNCSTDKSKQIAQSYGSKIYMSKVRSLPLGCARRGA